MRRTIACLAGVCGFVAVASPSHGQSEPAVVATLAEASEPDLAAVRAATERYRDLDVALAEGYVKDPMNICDTAEMLGRPAQLGVMGIHYFRPDLLGITGPRSPDGRQAQDDDDQVEEQRPGGPPFGLQGWPYPRVPGRWRPAMRASWPISHVRDGRVRRKCPVVSRAPPAGRARHDPA